MKRKTYVKYSQKADRDSMSTPLRTVHTSTRAGIDFQSIKHNRHSEFV